MSRARQNLRKRMRHAAWCYGKYDPARASWGPEWERLGERAGMPPRRTATPEDMARKLTLSSVYGSRGPRSAP